MGLDLCVAIEFLASHSSYVDPERSYSEYVFSFIDPRVRQFNNSSMRNVNG